MPRVRVGAQAVSTRGVQLPESPKFPANFRPEQNLAHYRGSVVSGPSEESHCGTVRAADLCARCPRIEIFQNHIAGSGWGGRIRTCECRYQKPVPYHLATPQQAHPLMCGRAGAYSQGLRQGKPRRGAARRLNLQLAVIGCRLPEPRTNAAPITTSGTSGTRKDR